VSDNVAGEMMHLPSKMDVYAPDGSEIRLLLSTSRGSSCHCTLPANGISLAGMHRSVEEIWYCVQGRGQVWRKRDEQESEIEIFPGVCLSIPPYTQFQFRTVGVEALEIIITTMPPWPGEQEWIKVEDHWQDR
jgi:mannose-6-phosphate isomerase-like protein (cupin superfamily)